MQNKFRLRFSLRSLLFGTLMLGALTAVWRNFDPWRVEREFHGEGDLRGFSPDGKWINADWLKLQSPQNRVMTLLWNVETGESCTLDHGKRDAPFGCWSQFSSDSKILFSQVLNPKECGLKVWDLKAESELDIAAAKRKDITSSDISPKGGYLVVRFSDLSMELVDLRTNTSVMVDDVTHAVFSPSDDRVVLAGSGTSLRILETETGRELQRIEPPKEWEFKWREVCV